MFRQLHTRAFSLKTTSTAASVAVHHPRLFLPYIYSLKTCASSPDRPQLINKIQLRGNFRAIAEQQRQIHTTAAMASATGFYDFKPLDKRGQEVPLADYKGKVVLVVNTASKCGFTPQYAGLEKLYKDIKEKHGDDFIVLGFPCNQFGGQEPGSDDEIQNFCQVNYGVSFPIMQKIDVNGDAANPLFQWLKEEKPGIMGLKRIKWNFEKFLVGRDGQVKGRWASTTKPESLEKPILDELEKK
ncbi:glutathione peroxidase [Colletotrichum limetticola]|nr:glutathione peroxidase [Colletotrichum limetticola]